MLWTAIIIASIACYGLKLAGLLMPSRVLDKPLTQQIAILLPVAVLAALAVTQAFSTGQHLVLDARAAGLAAAVVAILLRAPFLLVVVTSAACAALVRLLA